MNQKGFLEILPGFQLFQPDIFSDFRNLFWVDQWAAHLPYLWIVYRLFKIQLFPEERILHVL